MQNSGENAGVVQFLWECGRYSLIFTALDVSSTMQDGWQPCIPCGPHHNTRITPPSARSLLVLSSPCSSTFDLAGAQIHESTVAQKGHLDWVNLFYRVSTDCCELIKSNILRIQMSLVGRLATNHAQSVRKRNRAWSTKRSGVLDWI